jgi:hypothetical protein
MDVIEILAYTPTDMDQFVAFAKDGKPDGQGDYQTDEQGRKITGVIRWLLGRGVPKAQFFNSNPKAGDAVNLFAATVQRRESYDVPWMKNIPGFEPMVTTDGLIGKTASFAPLSDLLASVKTNKELEDKFNNGRINVDGIIKAIEDKPEIMPSIGRLRLLAALRGEQGSNPAEVFEEVKRKFDLLL